MSDTPIMDGIPGAPADDETPEVVADQDGDRADADEQDHDENVPESVPETEAVQDDDGAAVFVASTDPADVEPDPMPNMNVEPDTAPDNPTYSAVDVPATDDPTDVALDNGADTLSLVKDTNDRIRNIETIVSQFVTDVKPFLERIEKGGITALIGGLFGSRG